MGKIKDSFFGGAEKSAGKVQARLAQEGIEEQRRQFDITQQQLSPFRQTGVDALNQQRILLGLGALPPQDQQLQQASQVPSVSAPGPFGAALRLAAGVARQTRADQQQALAPSGPELSPLEQQQQAFAAFAESPGQRFIRERQEKALLRGASAIGGLGGGNVRTALQQQAAGFAMQDFQNQLNRLAGLSGTGQQAAVQTGQLGAQTASNIQAGLEQKGAARASGITGSAAGFRRGVQGLSAAFI
jgi:hypothetical protein